MVSVPENGLTKNISYISDPDGVVRHKRSRDTEQDVNMWRCVDRRKNRSRGCRRCRVRRKPRRRAVKIFAVGFVRTRVVDDGVSEGSPGKKKSGSLVIECRRGGLILFLLRGCRGRYWRCRDSLKVDVRDAAGKSWWNTLRSSENERHD